MKKTAVIIVNWNGWKDTIECLSSFEWPQLPDTCFYVLDNASQDQSIPQLQSWLTQQKINFITCPPESLDTIVNQALNAPQPQSASQQSTAQPQSTAQKSTAQHPNPPQPNAPQSQSHAIPPQPQIFLVANPSNAGFAGGNNIILRHLLRSGIFHQAWLLNNDTTVLPDSLPELSTFLNADPNRAFAGSVLLDYAKPTLVQCCGVRYYRYLGVSKLYMKNRPWQEIAHQDAQPPHPTDYYQIGASLMVKLEMLKQIGLMDERFFMYSEEADWQIRAKKKGLGNDLAWRSVIYHKGTVSTAGRKHLFFYHYNRSAIIMTRKNFGRIAGWTATLALTGITMLRARCRPKQTFFGFKGLLAGWDQHIAKIL